MALDSPTGGGPHTCAQFNAGGYETVRLLQLIYGDTLLSGRPRYDLPKFLGQFAAPVPTTKSLLLSPAPGRWSWISAQ